MLIIVVSAITLVVVAFLVFALIMRRRDAAHRLAFQIYANEQAVENNLIRASKSELQRAPVNPKVGAILPLN